MAKTKTPTEEKFEKIDFNLFEALEAIDRKDYGYYDILTEEQKKKFSPYMMLIWASSISNKQLQKKSLIQTNSIANKYFFNENIQKHPKLQWLMLCASGLGVGKQYHQWIPHIREKVSKLQDDTKNNEIHEYYKKIYPTVDKELIEEISNTFLKIHKKKMYLSKQFPNMKLDDIELLNELTNDFEIEKYKQENGE